MQILWKAEFEKQSMRLQTHHILTGSLLPYLKRIKAVVSCKKNLRVVKLPLQPLGESEDPKETILGITVFHSNKKYDDMSVSPLPLHALLIPIS